MLYSQLSHEESPLSIQSVQHHLSRPLQTHDVATLFRGFRGQVAEFFGALYWVKLVSPSVSGQ